jgi:Spy/CpxP family protein refolding chaperone
MVVKARFMMTLLVAGALTLSAGAQERYKAQSVGDGTVSLPRGATSSPELSQPTPATGEATGYPQDMETVLRGMAEELGQVAQAFRDGKITREQADYLIIERYYVGLMRFQVLRTLYQDAQEATQRPPSSQASAASQTSGDNVVLPQPASSPDVSQPIAAYLELTPAQITAIQTQISEARAQVQPLLDQLETSRRTLISNTLNGHFDANQVRSLAAEQGRIMQQLIEANVRLTTKVYGILTSAQQRKLDELRRQVLVSVKATFPDW